MKILYVASAIRLPGTSGGATHVLEVAGGLAQRGHQVHVVAQGRGSVPADQPFATTLLPWPDKLAYLGLPTVARLARQLAPDVIMERFYNFAGAGMTVAHRTRRPAVLEVNAPMMDPPGSRKAQVDRLLGGRLRHWAVGQARFSRRIITPLATTVPPEVPRGKIELVNWGANVDQFRPALRQEHAAELATLRREYGIAEDAVVVAFVGSFRAWHGANVFADAALQLIPQHPRLTFLAIGDGPELAPLRARLAGAGLPPGRFVLTGPQPHDRVPRLLALAHIGVAPFVPAAYAPLRTFGFYWSPLKVFEYMAMALPVVTLDIPPLHTIVRAGQDGLLYPEGDTSTLIAHLATLAADSALRARLGESARARVVAHYSWAAHCAQLEDILMRVKRET